MMRSERDLTTSSGPRSSGARLFADQPYEPRTASVQPASADPTTATSPSPVAQPVLTALAPRTANYEDWSIPRPSRIGIAPAPVPVPAEPPRMSFDEIRQEVGANTGASARMLVCTLRLSQRCRGTKIAGALSGLLHRIVSRALFCDIPPETAIAHGLRIERAFSIVIDPRVRIGARCLLRHGVTLSAEAASAPVIGHDVQFGCYAVVAGRVEIPDGSRVAPLSLTSA